MTASSPAIADIHRQGGVAIAAHPYPEWSGYDDAAVQALDAAEIVRPEVYADEARALQLRQFAARRRLTQIGASDYHGLGTLGASRTYVFARDDSERAILSALHEGRTVVYSRDGRAYGDPELIRLAAQDQRLALAAAGAPQRRALALLSRVAGVLGLLLLA